MSEHPLILHRTPKQNIVDSSEKTKRESHKREKRMIRLISQAIAEYQMIEPHDRVMVCVSGGKDSLTLLHLLKILQKRTGTPFELIAFNLDQGQPGFPKDTLPKYFEAIGIPYHIEEQDTYSVVKRVIPEGKTKCSLCSRLRRGVIYRVAEQLGATKIALGHHRDDILATFFLNLFFGGKLKTMPAKLRSENGKHIVIRPLAYVEEEDCEHYALEKQFQIIPCTLCGSQPNLQRSQMASMLAEWKKKHPGRLDNIFRAMGAVKPAFLLDQDLYPFNEIQTDKSTIFPTTVEQDPLELP